MKEIKFRAWDKREKRWYDYEDSEVFIDLHGQPLIYTAENPYPFANTDIQLMQYTGLKDSKRTEEYPEGQEIYEGDIVVGKWFIEHGEPVLSMLGKVIFNQRWCAFCIWDEQQKTISELNACGNSSWEIEVIGNIHDNPELLK